MSSFVSTAFVAADLRERERERESVCVRVCEREGVRAHAFVCV